MALITKDIELAKNALVADDVVGIPTETVYGLAGNAFSEKAVLKIFKVKERPSFDPLIVHTCNLSRIPDLVTDFPDWARALGEAFWPGPLTIVLPKSQNIPDLVSSGLDTVGIRIPRHPLTLALLGQLDFPLAAPSANPFGYVSPTSAQHVNDQLGARIPVILDGGPSSIGIESTIVGLAQGVPTIFRLGGKNIEEIKALVGDVVIQPNASSNPRAPGMLKSHYAPGIPVVIGPIDQLISQNRGKRLGVLTFQKVPNLSNDDVGQVLSKAGNLDEAARHLFGALRSFDREKVELIIAEPFPNYGIGMAINDRLQRASVK